MEETETPVFYKEIPLDESHSGKFDPGVRWYLLNIYLCTFINAFLNNKINFKWKTSINTEMVAVDIENCDLNSLS